MIKLIVLCTKIIVLAIAALLFTSCKFDLDLGNGIDGNGNVKTENRTISEKFSKIDVSSGIEVQLEQAETTSVEVEADSNLLQHITTKVVNGTLEITTDENIDTSVARNVKIKMPKIEALNSSSGASIHINNTIRGNSIQIKSSSGSEVEATLEFENIDLETSSGSATTLTGKALKFSSKSSSGSEINADKLEANEVYAQATSGSSTDVNAILLLNAKSSSGSSIKYSGKAKSVVKEETSGGSVSGN